MYYMKVSLWLAKVWSNSIDGALKTEIQIATKGNYVDRPGI